MTLLMQRRMKTGSLAERYDGQGPHELREFERERVTSVCSFATSRGSAPARAVRSPMSASCRRRRRASASSTSVRVPSWSMPHHDGSHKPTAAGEQQENGLTPSAGVDVSMGQRKPKNERRRQPAEPPSPKRLNDRFASAPSRLHRPPRRAAHRRTRRNARARRDGRWR